MSINDNYCTLKIEYWRLEWYNFFIKTKGDSKVAVNQLRVVMSVLKEVSEGNIPKAEDYGIEEKIFYNILDAMQDDGLIKNIRFSRGADKKVMVAFLQDAIITIRGMEYLHSNSTLMKTYKGLKEVREWLPF